MAKDKLTEARPRTRCEQLVDQVHTEERVKLEERFKKHYKEKQKRVAEALEFHDTLKANLENAQEEYQKRVIELNELKNADLDQWGKENPEPKPCILYGRDSNIAMSNMTATAACRLEENHRDSLDSFRMAIDAMKKHPPFFQIPFPNSLL
jgi:hypothetical protein